MNIAQSRSIMKAFICSQCGYCSLVWMLHSRKINNRENSLHERALRVVYRDYNATFSELLSKDNQLQFTKEIYNYLQQRFLRQKMN